jgi:hypothetical protein
MNYQEINKKNIYKWEEALKYLTTTLRENNINYYLSASGLHYILGEKIYPYDIDIFVSKKDIPKIYEILKEYTISDIHRWENKLLEFQGEYMGIPFEICEWEKEPKQLVNSKFKDFEISIVE